MFAEKFVKRTNSSRKLKCCALIELGSYAFKNCTVHVVTQTFIVEVIICIKGCASRW